MRRHAYSKTSLFVVHTRTIDLRFQKSQLSKAFSKVFVFEDFRFWKPLFFDRLSVDEYMQTEVFENALLWTGSKTQVNGRNSRLINPLPNNCNNSC